MKHNMSYVLVVLATVICAVWVSTMDIYLGSKAGLIFFFFFFFLLIEGLGKTYPFKIFIGFILSMQMLASPIIIYNFFENDVLYKMEVDQEIYVSYVLGGAASFLLGLFIPLFGRTGSRESLSERLIPRPQYAKLGLILITIAVVSKIAGRFAPGSLAFMFHILQSLLFIGVFYILHSNMQRKWLWIAVTYGYYVFITISGGIFINLFIWGFFLLMLILVQYRLSFVAKLALIMGGFYVAFFIQSIKQEYRDRVAEEKTKGGGIKEADKQKLFYDIASAKASEDPSPTEDDFSDLNNFVSRLNQGWILSNVLAHVPKNQEFNGGSLLKQEVMAAFVPRILNPGKITSGGASNERKFNAYTGNILYKGTTMRIGFFGDAYISFGVWGGFAMLLGFGLFLNFGLWLMEKYSVKYPTLILWIPFVFSFSMRGTDVGVVLNYMTKSAVVMVGIVWYLDRYMRRQRAIPEKTQALDD